MHNSTKKRSAWKEREVIHMLGIIRDSQILNLLSKTKHNKFIYEDIANTMALKGFSKTAIQIRGKFKSLKLDYYKAKRNNNSSGADQESCPFFSILDKILGSQPAVEAEVLNNSQVSTDSCLDEEVIDDISEDESTIEINEYDSNANADISNTSNRSISSPALKRFKVSRKQTCQKVMDNFTKEWKKSQNNLIKVLEKQEEKYIANIEKLMEKNRNETRKLMEEDRKETAKMFSSLLSSLAFNYRQVSYPHVDNNEIVEDASTFVSTPQTSPIVKLEPNGNEMIEDDVIFVSTPQTSPTMKQESIEIYTNSNEFT